MPIPQESEHFPAFRDRYQLFVSVKSPATLPKITCRHQAASPPKPSIYETINLTTNHHTGAPNDATFIPRQVLYRLCPCHQSCHDWRNRQLHGPILCLQAVQRHPASAACSNDLSRSPLPPIVFLFPQRQRPVLRAVQRVLSLTQAVRLFLWWRYPNGTPCR